MSPDWTRLKKNFLNRGILQQWAVHYIQLEKQISTFKIKSNTQNYFIFLTKTLEILCLSLDLIFNKLGVTFNEKYIGYNS